MSISEAIRKLTATATSVIKRKGSSKELFRGALKPYLSTLQTTTLRDWRRLMVCINVIVSVFDSGTFYSPGCLVFTACMDSLIVTRLI